MKRFCSLILSLFMVTGIFSTTAIAKEEKTEKNEKIVASYIPLYEKWKAEDIKGNLLTDAIIAFAKFDENNRLCFDKNDQTAVDEVRRLSELYPHLNITLSVGGWGVSEFSEVMESGVLRALFVTDCIELLETYNMNGIDMDWEYPVGEGWLPDVDKKWQDKENFTKVMKELKSELDKLEKKNGREYILSYATNVSEWAITNLEYKEIFNLVDRINLMGYAYEGSWSSKTGHASALYLSKDAPHYALSSSAAVEQFVKYGVDKNKLVLGVPSFSQEWYGVNNISNGLGQTFKGSDNLNMGYTKLKSDFINKNGFTRYWDDDAKMPYLFNGDMFISYEDEQSIECKAKYILDEKLGGIMNWQYFQDRNGELLNVMSNTLNPKIDEINQWKTEVEYKKDDIVLYNGIEYKCLEAHKSIVSWIPDKANTLWTVVPKNNQWAVGVKYEKGDKVIFQEKEYQCLQEHVAIEDWNPNNRVLWK